MPRIARGPYLKLRQREGSTPTWYIIDGDKRTSTGLSAEFGEESRQALADYISTDIATKSFGKVATNRVTVSEIMILYATDCIPKQARPEEAATRMQRIVEFFGQHTVDDVPGAVKAYVRWRTHEGNPTKGDPPRVRRPVQESSARRELEDLRSAITHAYKSRKISSTVPIELPDAGAPRERWLTRSEAARLLAGSLGFVLAPSTDLKTRAVRWTVWRRDRGSINRHCARFIILGLYTATRHSAILNLGFTPHAGGGHFDLVHGVFYRAPRGAKKTKKRQPPARIPRGLLPHIVLWKRLASHDQTTVIWFRGASIERIHKAFRGAVELAGLDSTVTPHVLRHTCVTWRMQKGIPAWKVAGFAGMTVEMIETVYGHHAPDFLSDIADDF